MSENESDPSNANSSSHRIEALDAGAVSATIAAAMGAIEGIVASGRVFGDRQKTVAAAIQSTTREAAQSSQSAAPPAQSVVAGLQEQMENARTELSAAITAKRRSANSAAATESLQRARAGAPVPAADIPSSPALVDPDLAQRMRRLILSELHPAPTIPPVETDVGVRQVEDWAGSNWEASNADQPTATVAAGPAAPAENPERPHTSFDSWFESTGHTPARIPPESPVDAAAQGSDSIDQFQKQWQAWRKRVEGRNSPS